MTTMLTIDTTSRDLAVWTANVTRAECGGLVVRYGLRLPSLGWMVRDRDWRCPLAPDLPVLLIGEGYQARSSAGHVTVHARWAPDQAVVGVLDDRALRSVWPCPARILGRTRIVSDGGTGNSNPATAAAVEAGADLLMQVDPTSVIITEGQSDRAGVVRLLPGTPGERFTGTVVDLDPEHREERFTMNRMVRDRISGLRHHAPDLEGEELARAIDTLVGDITAKESAWRRIPRGYAEPLEDVCHAERNMALRTDAEPGDDPTPEDRGLAEWEKELML